MARRGPGNPGHLSPFSSSSSHMAEDQPALVKQIGTRARAPWRTTRKTRMRAWLISMLRRWILEKLALRLPVSLMMAWGRSASERRRKRQWRRLACGLFSTLPLSRTLWLSQLAKGMHPIQYRISTSLTRTEHTLGAEFASRRAFMRATRTSSATSAHTLCGATLRACWSSWLRGIRQRRR
jgi:hypothetical protein